jgi:hypothetical protein
MIQYFFEISGSGTKQRAKTIRPCVRGLYYTPYNMSRKIEDMHDRLPAALESSNAGRLS